MSFDCRFKDGEYYYEVGENTVKLAPIDLAVVRKIEKEALSRHAYVGDSLVSFDVRVGLLLNGVKSDKRTVVASVMLAAKAQAAWYRSGWMPVAPRGSSDHAAAEAFEAAYPKLRKYYLSDHFGYGIANAILEVHHGYSVCPRPKTVVIYPIEVDFIVILSCLMLLLVFFFD